MQTPERKLAIARSQLLLSHGFFGMLALRLRLVARDSISTLAVDGRSIFYNPKFVMGLTDSLLRSAVAHEVMHCVLDHMGRRNGREPRKWNQAGDYALNQILEDSGFEIGKDWLLHPNFKGMSADTIYTMLPDTPPGEDDPLDHVEDAPAGASEADATDWKIATIQAAKAASAAGKLPGSLQRFIEEATRPQVDWKEELRRFVTQRGKDDFSWSRPNRRYLAHGIFMPGLYSEHMGPMVVGIDTSGSIDAKTLARFGSEVQGIADSVRPSEVHVVYCDAAVAHVDVYQAGEPMKFVGHGGGGTAFEPVFQYVEQQGLKPECLVYLTDLYGHHGFTPPPYPTMWCSTTDQVASFGDTLRIEV